MRRIKLPHRELCWLPNSFLKGLTIPDIYVEEEANQNYSGYYEFEDGIGHLVIVENEHYASTLAHELRHHWQRTVGNLDQSSAWDPNLTYEDAIVKYFRTQSWEMDALLFEHKYAKDEINDYWIGLLNEKSI